MPGEFYELMDEVLIDFEKDEYGEYIDYLNDILYNVSSCVYDQFPNVDEIKRDLIKTHAKYLVKRSEENNNYEVILRTVRNTSNYNQHFFVPLECSIVDSFRESEENEFEKYFDNKVNLVCRLSGVGNVSSLMKNYAEEKVTGIYAGIILGQAEVDNYESEIDKIFNKRLTLEEEFFSRQ